MTLETTLRRFLLLPHFIQMGNDKPPKPHWVGNKEPIQQNQAHGEKKKDDSPKKRNTKGYRDLSSITLGEVNDVYQYFADQLIPSPHPGWIATNHFCMIDLVRKRDDHPPAMFGRVKTCYPSDGYIQNIQDMELFFPRKDGAPNVILLQAGDILLTRNKSIQSYCMRAKFLASPEDTSDFDGHENLFLEQGFFPEFETGYIDLLDVNEQNHSSLPWLYVIGSRWFASIPVSVQPEIREKIGKLIHWNKSIVNYHPEKLPNEIRSLNRELGLKAGFSDIFLIEPENPQQTVQIVTNRFDKVFSQAMGK